MLTYRSFHFSILSQIGLGLISFFTSAQNIYRYPTSVSQYLNSYILVNPASGGLRSKAELSFGNQEYIGPLRRVKNYYVYVGIRTNKAENTKKSVLAFFASNEKDGDYINRSRVYLNYAWHTQLSDNLWIGAGAFAGFINYTFDGTTSTGGGSDFRPDGSLGILLHNDDLHIGLSVNQILNSRLKPLIAQYTFPVYYNFTFNKNIELSPHFKLKPSSLITLKPSEKLVDYNVGFLTTIDDKVVFGTNYKHQAVVSFLVGVQNIEFDLHSFSLNISYNRPIGQYSVVQSVELVFGYNYSF